MNTDPRVDAYIEKAPSFAQPILSEVRSRIRKGCPDAIETIKWNVPFYLLDGKLLGSMAAFKKHAKIGVWGDAKPDMVDVPSLEQLTSAKDFALKLKAAIQRITRETVAPSAKQATKPIAKKTAKPVTKKVSKRATAPNPIKRSTK
jgi:hypothetical protein